MEKEKGEQNEGEILHPERELMLNGELVIVNEFSFLQGMKADALAQPLIADMSALFHKDEHSADPSYASLTAMFDKHADIVMQLLSLATGKNIEWIEQLGDTEGQSLLMTFWSINSHFFINRLLIMGTEHSMAITPASVASTAH